MVEFAKTLYDVFNTPGGLLMLFILIGVAGWRGVWRWQREVLELKEENRFLRQALLKIGGASERTSEAATVLASVLETTVKP